MALGVCLAFLTIAFVLLVDGLPVQDPNRSWVLAGRKFPRFYHREPTILWAAVALPLFVVVAGFLQLVLGRPFRELPAAWDGLGGCGQPLIVYGLLIAIPALISWLASLFSLQFAPSELSASAAPNPGMQRTRFARR